MFKALAEIRKVIINNNDNYRSTNETITAV